MTQPGYAEPQAGEVAAAEKALYRAMLAKDFEALRELLCDDLVYIHSTAVSETKEAYLEGIHAGLYDYGAIETRRADIWVRGDVAVTTGIVDMSVGERGAPKDRLGLLFTLVWRREGSGWRLALRQATRMPPPGTDHR